MTVHQLNEHSVEIEDRDGQRLFLTRDGEYILMGWTHEYPDICIDIPMRRINTLIHQLERLKQLVQDHVDMS